MAQDELETRMIYDYTSFEDQTMEKIDKIFEEEFDLAKKRISTRIKEKLASSPRRIAKNGNQSSSRRSMRLQFNNRFSQPILTGEEIKGEGDTSIEVALFDDSTGNIVDNGLESSATVEIVLLKGESDASNRDDWTVEEFYNHIIHEMEKPLLAGNLILKLERGIAVLDKINFRHHSTKVKPPVFRLGARIVDTFGGVRVKEAKTESFTVKDFRGKYYKKYETPSLSDKVYHLVNIRKGGKIDKSLRDDKIETVEDLLIRLLIDPHGLKSIVTTLGAKKWEATVNNARACLSDKRMYCYINSEQKTGVVFNVLGQVLGLYLNNQYASINMLSENQKAYADAQDLLTSAYKHWENVMPFDDKNSLQQYFSNLSTYVDLLESSLTPYYPDGGREVNTETFETIGESSSRRSNFSLNSASSTMNSIRENGGDFGSSGTDEQYLTGLGSNFPLQSLSLIDLIREIGIDDMEIISGDFWQHSSHSTFNLESMVEDFDVIYQKEKDNGPINEDADEQIGAAAVTFVQSQVVHISKPPKRWKKLLCVSRWFTIRKKISIGGNHNRKKQKVC